MEDAHQMQNAQIQLVVSYVNVMMDIQEMVLLALVTHFFPHKT